MTPTPDLSDLSDLSDASELVTFDVAATLALLALPEHAAQLREGTLTWASALELLVALTLTVRLYQVAMRVGAERAVRAMIHGDAKRAVAELALSRGQTVAQWAADRRDELHAPECHRCGQKIDDARIEQTSVHRAHELGWQYDEAADRWDCGCPATASERHAAHAALVMRVDGAAVAA